MRPHLTVEQRQLALRLKARGLSLREIGPQVGCSHQGVALIVRQASRRPVRHDGWVPGPGRLTLADREEITLGLHAGQSFTAIAARLGKAVSTVSREVAANGGREGYRAWRAHARAREQARRPKTPKLACPQLAAQVSQWLAEWWSPVQISRRLRIEFPHDPMMGVSHETIYQALYVQGRGELRRELARCLRSGRAKRRSRGPDGRSGHIKDMVMISQRPAEAADRAVPGHWEGDLIIGKDCKSAVGTLVERTTRYVLLLHLPRGRDAHLVELEHPGFGGDSILPRCSGLGDGYLPRYRRLAEPRSDHFPLLPYRTSVQLRCPSARLIAGLCPARKTPGGWVSPRRAPPACAAGPRAGPG
jgi:transposase, IS30 family